ncbi:hypothetical protein MNSC_07700 [Minisyncoccus archaeophilus]|uniref:hypothetical protein n=1 Tax=Minisyncoccus archaeiphilus TaxID=3238481 RepID=UPI00399C7693
MVKYINKLILAVLVFCFGFLFFENSLAGINYQLEFKCYLRGSIQCTWNQVSRYFPSEKLTRFSTNYNLHYFKDGVRTTVNVLHNSSGNSYTLTAPGTYGSFMLQPCGIDYYGRSWCDNYYDVENFSSGTIGGAPAVNGQCGSRSGTTVQDGSLSSGSSGLCSAGSVASFQVFQGNYWWKCQGSNGGSTSDWCIAYIAARVNGQCGSANGVTFPYSQTSYGSYTQCSTGSSSNTAFPAQGSTVYWNCNGSNGGSNASCYASRSSAPAAVNGQCGSRSGTTVQDGSLSSGSSGLCSAGSVASFQVFQGNYWWKCQGSNGGSTSDWCIAYIAARVNGQCGSANGVTFPYSQTSYGSYTQCSTGSSSNTAFPAQGSTVYWNCNGSNGGSNASCYASRSSAPAGVNGTCNNSCKYCCSSGTLGTTYDYNPTYYWYCNGSNGGSSSGLCMITIATPVNGQCGSAYGGSFSSAPTSGLCNQGSPSSPYQSGSYWVWSCSGSNGGSNATCIAYKTASPVNGVCNNSCKYCCSAGTLGTTYDYNPTYFWYCNGTNGGSGSSLCMITLSNPCTSCGSWTACSNGTRTCTSLLPSGCSGGSVPMTQSCGTPGSCSSSSAYACSSGYAINQYHSGNYYQWNCASYDGGVTSGTCTYTAALTCTSCGSWTTCSNGTRTCTSLLPSGCSGGSVPMTQSCGTPGVCNNSSAYACSSGYAINQANTGVSFRWNCASYDGGATSSLCNYNLSTPSSLTCSGASASQVNCSWTGSSGATSYELQRDYSTVGSPSSTFYADSSLSCGTSYSYRVRACIGSVCSSWSNSSSALTYACNPTSLVCSGLSGTRIQCSWGQAPNTVNSYQLDRKKLADPSFVTIQNSASRTYSNNDHSCGTIYSYRVRACNTSGCSGYISYNAMTNACPACGAAEGQKTMIKPAQSLLCTPATVTISDITLVKNQWTWRCGIGAEDGPPVNCEAPRSNPLIIEP